jgi:hypothetical protein
MYKSRTLLAAGILLLAAGAASGRSVQVGQVPGVGNGSAGSSAGVGMYSPPGVGNLINNVSIVSAPVVQNAASIAGAIGNNNINAQTNIDVSKSVDTTSNIDVTETINGSNVAYGFSGANVLNVIDNASNFDSGVSSNGAAAASAAVADALLAAELGN